MQHSGKTAEVRDGVPTGILEALERAKTRPNRQEKILSSLRDQPRRKRSGGETSFSTGEGFGADLQRIDEVAFSRLQDLGGKDRVFRPSGVLQTYSGRVPTGVNAIRTPIIGVPLDPKDIYQHFHLHCEGSSEGLLNAGLAGALLPAPWGLIFANTLNEDANDFKQAFFDFSGNSCPEDGEFLVTMELVAWGTYTLISDDQKLTSCDANAQLYASCYGLDPDYVGNLTLLDVGDDNINEPSQPFGVVGELIGCRTMKAGDPLYITPHIWATTSARGDNSIADLNLEAGVGGIGCIGLTLQKIS